MKPLQLIFFACRVCTGFERAIIFVRGVQILYMLGPSFLGPLVASGTK